MHEDDACRIDTASGPIWELPVQWTLDDAAWLAHPSDPAGMLAVWTAELAAARRERRHVTLTLHPEISGMAHRADALRGLLAELVEQGAHLIPHGAVIATRPAVR